MIAMARGFFGGDAAQLLLILGVAYVLFTGGLSAVDGFIGWATGLITGPLIPDPDPNPDSVYYSLTVASSSGGSVSKNPNRSSYLSGSTVQLTATPSSGYTFTSWSRDATGSVNPQAITMNGDKQVTATFTQSNPNPLGFVSSAELINHYSMTTTEAQTFVNLIDAQGFSEVTIRLNAMDEWSSGQPSSSGVAKTRELITICQAKGIAVNIDLHTWYSTWDSNFDSSASSAASKRVTYLSYVKNTINAFSGAPVKAWMVLNEPQAQPATADENQFLLDCLNTAKQQTSSPVSIRFMCGYSPSTGHYSQQIDQASGFLCRNTYWDPRTPSVEVYGTTQAKMTAAIAAANSQGKEIWITEFGKRNTNQAEQAAFIRAFIDWAGPAGVDRVYAWAMQPENPSLEPYNLFGSNYEPLPAFYELVN